MNANEILGVATNASLEDIRAAYLSKVKEFPPDRCPEEFEKIRDAYNSLRDPRRHAKAMLQCNEAGAAFASLVKGMKARRIFAGPQPWKEALKIK